jgi:hypothetical protein
MSNYPDISPAKPALGPQHVPVGGGFDPPFLACFALDIVVIDIL